MSPGNPDISILPPKSSARHFPDRTKISMKHFALLFATLAFSDLLHAQLPPKSPSAPTKSIFEGKPFKNPGVYSQVAAGRVFEWIPTEDVNFQVLQDGRVKLILPPTKQSFNGGTKCKPFIYDHAHRRLLPADQKALTGPGMLLPYGNFGFAILWINAKNYDEVSEKPWDLTDNPATYQGNSGQLDYVYLSVIPTMPQPRKPSPIQEVMLPYDLQRVSWLPHYQALPLELKLPPDKGFGITRVLWDIPLDEIYRKVTHIQYAYSELDKVPESKKWITKRAYDNTGTMATNDWLIKNHPMDPNFITFAELDENFGNHGVTNHLERAQQVFEGLYKRIEKERKITSPNQTRIYDDYFSAMGGYDNGANFLWQFNIKMLEEGLSSEALARKRSHDGVWKDECSYFSRGAYKYRNWFQGGYLDSYARNPHGVRIYNEIYNFEKRFMAAPDRRVAKFGWTNGEGVNSKMFVHGAKHRLNLGNGDIIRSDVIAWPFHMMLNESFWTLLLGNDYVLWHSNVRLVSDPNQFGDSWAAGAGKTRWQPKGGKIVDYDEKNSAHPNRKDRSKGQFPNNPHTGESGAFAGAWLVSQITSVSDRISKSIEYAPFSYKVNGGASQKGYYNSEEPKKGSLGNAQLSRYGVANYGQSNIVRSYEAKKPICIYTEGTKGAAVIFQNVYCGLADLNEVTIKTKTGPKVFQVRGNDLHVFYVN